MINDNYEIEKFNKISNHWWESERNFKMLHKLNNIRIKYILNILKTRNIHLSKINILDIGCGGGLISERFAKMGAMSIDALDAGGDNIAIAKKHKIETENLLNKKLSNLHYHHIDSAGFLQKNKNKKYDIIFALEIIEHIDNQEEFFNHISKFMKKNSLLFISTLNKTIKSYFQSIILAEKILKLLDNDTHNFNKFITPYEIYKMAKNNDIKLIESKGIKYNPIKSFFQNDIDDFYLSEDLSVNYIMLLEK